MKPETNKIEKDDLLFGGVYLRLFFILAIFIAAFSIRIYRITEAPLDFHPTRQYHSAIIARACYFESLSSIPQWRQDVAMKCRERRGIIEPPILEYLTCLGYRVLGGAHLWLPRAISSVFWLIGGFFLYLLAKDLVSADAALFAVVFYLFVPYGISASRSFQPDPMMVMMLLVSIYAIWQYFSHPSITLLITAAVASSFTLFIKPMPVFFIFGAYVSLAIYTFGIRKGLFNRNFIIFSVITFLPTLLYCGYGLFVSDFLQKSTRTIFLQGLLLRPVFWNGLLDQLGKVMGVAAVLISFFGIFLFRKGQAKAIIIGLWCGYLVYGCVFPYAFHTHDYYHLPLIPIVALSLAPIAHLVTRRLSQIYPRFFSRIPIYAVMFFAVFLVIYQVKGRLFHPDYEYHVKQAKEIGSRIGHSTQTIFLAPFYGTSLVYHGEFVGSAWPNTGDLRTKALLGEPILSAKERFEAEFLEQSAKYFIVTSGPMLNSQPDLKKFLVENFAVYANNNRYIIFDLNKKVKSNN